MSRATHRESMSMLWRLGASEQPAGRIQVPLQCADKLHPDAAGEQRGEVIIMARYYATVKAKTIGHARRAALKRDMGTIDRPYHEDNYGSVTLVVVAEPERICAWFCELPTEAPYPIGALLYYREEGAVDHGP